MHELTPNSTDLNFRRTDYDTVLCRADKEERDELLTADNTIIVMNKVDLVDENHMDTLRFMDRDGLKICWLSCKTEEGVKNFLNVLQAKLAELYVYLSHNTRVMTINLLLLLQMWYSWCGESIMDTAET